MNSQIEEILNRCDSIFPIVTPLALQVISKYVNPNDYKTVIKNAKKGTRDNKILDFTVLMRGLASLSPYCNNDIWNEIHTFRANCFEDASITTQVLTDKIKELNDIDKSVEYFKSLSKGESDIYIDQKLVKTDFKMEYLMYLLELVEFDKYQPIIDPVLSYYEAQKKSLTELCDPLIEIDAKLKKCEEEMKILEERKRFLEERKKVLTD